MGPLDIRPTGTRRSRSASSLWTSQAAAYRMSGIIWLPRIRTLNLRITCNGNVVGISAGQKGCWLSWLDGLAGLAAVPEPLAILVARLRWTPKTGGDHVHEGDDGTGLH